MVVVEHRILTATLRLLGALAIAALSGAAAVGQQAPPPAKAPARSQAQAPAQAAPAVPPLVAPAPGPVGVWIDHTGRGAVEIVQCGAGLCGSIVWMKEPNDKKGKPLRDILNEDARKRGRLICGLQIIGGLQEMRDGSWDRGWIYDPEQGASFDVELRLRAPDVLQVKGYKGLKFLSETFQWRRATAPLAPPCPPPAPV